MYGHVIMIIIKKTYIYNKKYFQKKPYPIQTNRHWIPLHINL